jgi:acyl-CoA dehydrogenase
MDFTLSPDVLMLRDMLRRFLETEVRPLESEYFSNGTLKPEIHARLHKRIEQMGLWGANLPFDLDGGELDQVTACVLEEELGKTFIPLDIGDIPPMLFACKDWQVEHFLKPVLNGKRKVYLAAREPASLRPEEWSTTARAEPVAEPIETYVIEGVKLLSGAPHAEDFLVVFAKTSPGHTAFLLDANQEDVEFVMEPVPAVRFKNTRVQPEAVLGKYGEALTLGAEEAPRAWIRIGARYVGLANRLLEMSAEYARDWIVYDRPLGERPAIQRMLAEMQVQLECCRWLVYHTAWLADQKDPVQIQTAEVRLATGQLLEKAIDCVTMIYGGPGPSSETERQRIVLGLLPYEAMEMMLESARAVVARHVLASARQTAG